MSQLVKSLKSALRESRWEDYEEIWLDAIEAESGELEDYLTAARLTLEANEGKRAALMLSLLAPQAATMKPQERCAFLEVMVCCDPKEADHREALIATYEEIHGRKPGYAVYLKATNIRRSRTPAQSIELFQRMIQFVPGCFVYHRSGWGVGEILDVNSMERVAIIDFERMPQHRVAVGAIPDICDLLPADDFRVLAWRDPAGLQEMAATTPVKLFKTVLRSTNRRLPLAIIREAIAGKVFPSNEWSRWWAKVRTAIKKDPEIGIGGDKKAEYFLRQGEGDSLTELGERLRGSDLKTRLRLLREALVDFPDERRQLDPHFAAIQRSLKHRDAELPLLLECLLFLHHEDYRVDELPTALSLIEGWDNPADVINGLSRVDDQIECLDLLRGQSGEGWPQLLSDLLLASDDAPREYLIRLMEEDGRAAEIDEMARTISRLPKRAPHFFLWLVRQRCGASFPLVPSIESATPADYFLRALLLLDDVAARSQHDPADVTLALQVKRMRQRIGGHPYNLMRQSLGGAATSVWREVYHQVEGCRGLSDAIRKRMLTFLLRDNPGMLSSKKRVVAKLDESTLYATESAIIRKRRELEYLCNDKLPEIHKAIGDAAEMGDLSENYEFASAIEERENTNRQVMELQKQLDRVTRIDLGLATTDRVSIGSRATLTNLETDETEVFSVLGPWDMDPEHGVVSYLSPLGSALMDAVKGGEVEVKLPEGIAHYRVEQIEVHVPQATDESNAEETSVE